MYILLLCALSAVFVFTVSFLYRRSWSKKLDITAGFDRDGIFEGERASIAQRFTNKKLLPVWWGSFKFQISGDLVFDGMQREDLDYYRNDPVSVWSYEMVSRSLPFTASKRGYYRLKDADFLTLDMFFRWKFIKPFPLCSELYVYPDAKQIQKFHIDFNRITGEIVKKRHIVEDPFQFRGIRDYYPFDSLKTVNWNATARTGEIKVNQYHYSSSQEVILLLDFDNYNDWDRKGVKEDAIRIAAHLVKRLLSNGIAVGMITNALSVSEEEIRIECRNGRTHYLNLLRGMAKIDTEKKAGPFGGYLKELSKSHDTRPQYLLISYYGGEDLEQQITDFRNGGMTLQWIFLKQHEKKLTVKNREDFYLCEEDE